MKSWLETRLSCAHLAIALGSLGVACQGELQGQVGAGGLGTSATGAPAGQLVGPDGKAIVTDPTNPVVVARTVDPKRESGLQRLSKSQYVNTVSEVFSADKAAGLELELDYRTKGFTSIGGRDVAISRTGVRNYEASAKLVAERVVADTALRSAVAGCNPTGAADGACLRQFVSKVGRRLFRRSLAADELQRYVAVGNAGAEAYGDFWQGAKLALTGLLLSPYFLYQVELGIERDGERVLNDLELATRLAFHLWDSAPDEALLSAAERGELTKDGRAQRARLLEDKTRLSRGVRAFGEGLFALYRLDNPPQSMLDFPDATPSLYASMKEAVQLLTVDIAVAQYASFLSLFSPGFAYYDAGLAPFYGVPAPASGFSKLVLAPGSARVGLLTEPGILAANSRATQTSPTLRGIFVTSLVCHEIPPPPANVNAKLPERPVGISRRQQLEQHMNQPTCAACHKAIDPIGFGLEGFDALGRLQDDQGAPMNTQGTYFDTAFNGVAELSGLLMADPKLASCIARKAYMHGLARVPNAAEDVLIAPLAERFASDRHDVVELLAGVAESGLFQLAPKPSEP